MKLWDKSDIPIVHQWINAETNLEQAIAYKKLSVILLRIANASMLQYAYNLMHDRKFIVDTCVNEVAIKLKQHYKKDTDENPFNFIFICVKNYLHDIHIKSSAIKRSHITDNIEDFEYEIDIMDETENIEEYDDEIKTRIIKHLWELGGKERDTLAKCKGSDDERDCIKRAERNLQYLKYFIKFIIDYGVHHKYMDINEYIQTKTGYGDEIIASCGCKFFLLPVHPKKAAYSEENQIRKYEYIWLLDDWTPNLNPQEISDKRMKIRINAELNENT